jgi:WhiB family redox-sensing transcriptional regulator
MLQASTGLSVHSGQSGGSSGSAATGRDWRVRVACRDVDPELFFPVGDWGPVVVAQLADAKAVCARCPVVAECLSFALVALPEGVAGGLTGEKRRVLRRQRHRASRSSAAGVRGRLPAGVDPRVVAQLMAGARVSGAARGELAHAAVGLHEAGHRAGWIAARLRVDARQVYRWLERHRAGRPLVPPAGRVGRVASSPVVT